MGLMPEHGAGFGFGDAVHGSGNLGFKFAEKQGIPCKVINVL